MTHEELPWLSSYAPEVPPRFEAEFTNALSVFRASVARSPEATAISYFDGRLAMREIDELSDALACALLAAGFERGDRVAVYLQNVPQFVIAMVAAWKAGGIMVSINPMSRQRELSHLLADSGATALVCLESLYDEVVREVVPTSRVRQVITTSPLEYQTRNDPRLFADVRRARHAGTEDMAELMARHAGQHPPAVDFAASDVALLTYTSGTTGIPKGAMNTHGNVSFNAQTLREWCRLTPEDVVLGVAPLFHVTGLIAHVAASLLVPMELVLSYRFEPTVLLETIRERRPTFTVAALPVYIALASTPGVTGEDLRSLRAAYSGGAPVTPAWATRFEEQFGVRIHSMYGLTETTSPSHAVPLGSRAPVDPDSGALSVGVPVPNTFSEILDEQGQPVPIGEVGEIAISGPQVVAGYWAKPEETEHAMAGGRLLTGDVGFMDENGWFYVVDRKKDMINASGFKVWPREVEDVLCEHPAVSEAAVVGIPDEYRGETVKAFVTLRPGAAATEDELIAHCKARMSAYKYPRLVEIIDVLPKTATGKLLRRELPPDRPVSIAVPGLDLVALTDHLDHELPGTRSGPLTGHLIAGGRSNLTYSISDGRSSWVLRRPPLGHVLETAHDMAREYRAMTALGSTGVPVPRMLTLCTDPAVLGAPFYMMSFVEGTVFRSEEELDALDAPAAEALADRLVEALVELHRVDPAEAGLADFGRPDGYLARQVRRWGKQLTASSSRSIHGLDELGARLAETVPETPRHAVVHGDYKLDNVVVSPASGRIVAILDWEMATLGDPLMDLVNVMLWWDGVLDTEGRPFAPVPARHPHFPPSSRLAEHYAALTGADLDALPWYTGLLCYKLAAIFEGMHSRQAQGLTVGEGFELVERLAPALANRGHLALDVVGS